MSTTESDDEVNPVATAFEPPLVELQRAFRQAMHAKQAALAAEIRLAIFSRFGDLIAAETAQL